MASSTSPTIPQTNGKGVERDALYLFEIFRESPHPILIHITPYAKKTGAKPNTIVKRLHTIKERHKLNITTTTHDPAGGDYSGATGSVKTKSQSVKVKKERLPKSEGTETTTSTTPKPKVDHKTNVKVETGGLGIDFGHGLPSPAYSPTRSGLMGGGPVGGTPVTMPQHKRKLAARDDHILQQVKDEMPEDGPAAKKMKKQA